MERDGFQCALCMDDKSTLHVHHKKYIYGRKPWEYKNEALVTLCENCHKKEHSALESKKKPSPLSVFLNGPSSFNYTMDMLLFLDDITVELLLFMEVCKREGCSGVDLPNGLDLMTEWNACAESLGDNTVPLYPGSSVFQVVSAKHAALIFLVTDLVYRALKETGANNILLSELDAFALRFKKDFGFYPTPKQIETKFLKAYQL